MWNGFTEDQIAAMQAGVPPELHAYVTNSAGTVVEDITYAIDATAQNTVTDTETATVRRTLQLELTDPTLIPASPSDLLHPQSGNELRIYQGVDGNDAPMGAFTLTGPDATSAAASGTSFSIQGSDRSVLISANKWLAPYTPAAGSTVEQVIQAVIDMKWTGEPLTYNLYPTGIVIPAGFILGVQFTSQGVQTESGSTNGNNDPWADCQQLAASAGCELSFDRNGNPTMVVTPQPGSTPTVFEMAEGAGCAVSSGSRSWDWTKWFNGVVVIGTGATAGSGTAAAPAAPVEGVAWAANATPPKPNILQSALVSTVAQAQAMADAQLALTQNDLDTVQVSALEQCWLDSGDQGYFGRQLLKLSGTYIASVVAHSLGSKSAMGITTRSYMTTTPAAP